MELMASFDRHSRRRSLASVAPVTPDGTADDLLIASPPAAARGVRFVICPASIQTNSSAAPSSKDAWWVTTKIVLPASRICASSVTISRAERTSTLEKGSSSSRILGSLSSARASDNLWRMPWEYCATGRVKRGIETYGSHVSGAASIISDAVEAGEIAQVLHAAHFVV